MSDDLVKRICEEWVSDGRANECFWETWPECPTEEILTPRMVLDRIEALIAALDEAEAERHRWRQAASLGSLHTQADLDRAVAKAHAEAYLSGWVNGSNGVEPPDFGNPAFEKAPGD